MSRLLKPEYHDESKAARSRFPVPNVVQIFITILFPALLCAVSILAMSKIAKRIGLIDRPDVRKKHVGEIPIVGGISIFLAVLIARAVGSQGLVTDLPVLIGLILIVVGVLDDRFRLSAFLRLPVQAIVALLMVIVGGVQISSIGSVLGGDDIMLSGGVAVAFTILCSVGVINSINMIDGVDGLSGVIVSITLMPLMYFCVLAGDYESLILLGSFLSAILSFLYFNARFFRKSALVFLGDAGSMFFGFLIVWFLVKLSQGPQAVLSPVSAGWIFGLPLVDTISVMVQRICEKRSPFDADRHHLHHKLLDAGFSVNQTVSVMGLFHAIFILVGVASNATRMFEPVFFWVFVWVVLVYFWKSQSLVVFAMRLGTHQPNGVRKL